MASREELINQRKLLQRKVSSGTATSADREKLKAVQIQIGKKSASAGVDRGPYAPYTEKQRAALNKQLPKSTKTVSSVLEREAASKAAAKKRRAALQSLVTESSSIDEDFAGRPSKKPVTRKKAKVVGQARPFSAPRGDSKKPVTKKKVSSVLEREAASKAAAKKRRAALQSLVTESSSIDEDFAGRPSKKPVTKKKVSSATPAPATPAPAKAAPVRPSSDVPFYKRESVLPLKSRTAAKLDLIPEKDAERGARQAKRQAEGPQGPPHKPLKSWEGGVRYIDNPFGKGKIKMDTSEKGMFGDSELDDMRVKKGGRLKKASGKKAVKKNATRKRAALRGHRAELRGG